MVGRQPERLRSRETRYRPYAPIISI